MPDLEQYISKLKALRVDRAHGGPAPHKPLLLLSVIDLIEEGQITTPNVALTPDLSYRFLSYWEIVHSRIRRPAKVVLPFYHLQSDGFWTLVPRAGMSEAILAMKPKSASALNIVAEYAYLSEDLFNYCRDPKARSLLRSALVSPNYFTESERLDLLSMLGIPSVVAPKEVIRTSTEPLQLGSPRARDVRFRIQIVPLYRYTCVLCSLRIVTLDGSTIVEAAHIREFADSRDDSIQNGFALCRNHHWAFDEGLWTVDDDCRIIVACGSFDEDGTEVLLLKKHNGQLLHFNIEPELHPNPKNFSWHKTHRFKGI